MSVLSEVDLNSSVELIEKESDDLFIDLIKSRPCLYDKKLPEHHNKIVIENAMEEIAFIMQDTVENCERRWKQFQSMYQKEKMLQEKESRSGAGASQRKKWPYYDQIKSLFSCNNYRNSYTNVNNESTKNNENRFSPDYQRRKKRKTDDMVTSVFTSVQNQLNSFMQMMNKENRPSVSAKKDCEAADGPDDCCALVGKLIDTRLNAMSPSSAKKKRKQIMKCLIDDDDDDDDDSEQSS